MAASSVAVRAISGSAALRPLIGSLTGAAGVIHIVHATTHLRPSIAVGIGFLVVGWLQLAAGMLTVSRPSRWGPSIAAVVNVAALGAWLLSRTVGSPLTGPVEPLGGPDGFTAVIELVAAVAAVRLLAPRQVRWQVPARAAQVVAGFGALALIGGTTFALLGGAHLHDAGHHGDAEVAGADSAVPVEAGHDIFGHPTDGSHEHDLFPQFD